MALVVRCSLAPSRPNSPRLPRLISAKTSTNLNDPGKPDLESVLRSGIVKFLKHASVVRGFPKLVGVPLAPFEMDEILSTSRSLQLKANDSWINTWKGTFVAGETASNCENITVKPIFAVQGTETFTHLTKALFVASSIMWIMPFEAVAETCEASGSSYNMPALLIVSLIGAAVGGLVARQRKGELYRLNDQLRQINAALRRQAKIESYAPSLSYAPVGARIAEDEVIVDPRKHELLSRLKAGKNLLRNQDPEKASLEFNTALELARQVKDPVEEKKAARGLGASFQRQRKYKEAINYHSMVLAISERVGETSGNTEAYGAIADCYTELGDLEKAGRFYDKYIATLESDSD